MSRLLSGSAPRVRLDRLAAAVGLLLAVGLFPLRFFASQIYIKTIPIVLGLACLLYLVATYREDPRWSMPTLSETTIYFLPAVVFAGFAALVMVAVLSGQRTLLFYVIAGVLGALIFAQIVFSSDSTFDRTLILVQIVVLAAVVRFAALYTTPGLIGIDIWTHVTQLAAPIKETGSLAAIESNKHYTSPFYHLLVVGASLLYDLPLRAALYLSLGLVMPLSALFVYGTTNLVVEPRWAALAALLFSVSDYAIEWGIHLIPTSLGLALFLGVTYWLVRIMRTDAGPREFVMLTAFTVAVILTHQVSTFIMLVLLGGGIVSYVAMRLRRIAAGTDSLRSVAREPVNLLGLVVFDAGLTTFLWSLTPYNGSSFLVTILSYLRETIASSAGLLDLAGPDTTDAASAAASQGPTLAETLSTYINTLGFLLLLFATFVGCLYVVNRFRARQSLMLLLVSAATMLVFVLGLPMFGIRNFIPQRWFAFLYVPMSILGVVGLRYFVQSLDRRILVVCLALIAVAFPMAMALSANGTIDNPVFENQEGQLSYDGRELAAVQTIGRMTGSPVGDEIRPDQVLFTDHPYQTVFDRTDAYPADIARINDSEPVTHDMVVYRQDQSRMATYFLNSRGFGEIRDIPRSRLCRPNQASIYTNDEVTMCVLSPASAT